MIVFFIIVMLVFKPSAQFRVVGYLIFFVLTRDAMTPERIWKIGDIGFLLWMRFIGKPFVLYSIGVFSLFFVIMMYYFDKQNQIYIHWFNKKRRNYVINGVIAGFSGTFLVVLPFLVGYLPHRIELRGGIVSRDMIMPILCVTILGNLLEEFLFRGYILGYLKRQYSEIKAGILSGIAFSFCHLYLATVLHNNSLPIILFTLWEGIIVGTVGSHFGVIPATISHGFSIFVLSTNIV